MTLSLDLTRLGLKRSHPAKLARRVSLERHPAVAAALASALPALFDLHQYEPPIFNQGNTGSCTAHSTSAAVVIALAATGHSLGFVPSMDLLYKATRGYERALVTPAGQSLPVLTDGGAELSDVYEILGRYGVAPMAEQRTSDGRYSDVEVASVNAEPNASLLYAAQSRLVVGPYGVDPSSPNVSDVLAAGIVSGVPIGSAGFVSSAFMRLQAGQVAGAQNQSDPAGGGHATVFTAYRPDPSGTGRQFKLRNSWSDAWGDAGYIWVNEAFIGQCWEFHPVAAVLMMP